MSIKTNQRLFYDEYVGEKIGISSFLLRVRKGIPMEKAISPELKKGTGRKPGTGTTKPSPDELRELEELNKYRSKMDSIKKEEDKAQIHNRIVGDIDPYYEKTFAI